jgi:hypothetical protein
MAKVRVKTGPKKKSAAKKTATKKVAAKQTKPTKKAAVTIR